MTEGWSEINNNFYTAYSLMLSFAGSFILYEPQSGCINDLIDMKLFKSLPVESDNPKFILAASYLRKINGEQPLDYDEIINDHLELFGGKGEAFAPPYGSVYMSKDHLMNDLSSREVRKIYNAYGWRSDMEGKVPDDHLGIELQFINLLLEKYPRLEDDVCRREIKTDILKFIDNFIKPWINQWNINIQENAGSNFYKGIGYLTVAGIEDVYSTMKGT